MVQVIGKYKKPKSAILKLNVIFNLSNLAEHTYEFILLKNTADINQFSVDKFDSNLIPYEQDYEGYNRQVLTNITRVDSIQDKYVWTADDVTFLSLNASLRYGLIVRQDTGDIIAIMDLEDVLTFAGDITFNLSVYGFLTTKV
jgi:hypothetical protein